MNRTERIASLFKSKPNIWIDGMDLAELGGQYAWRSRVSNCRTAFGMTIDNRVRWHDALLKDYRVSEYRYRPADVMEMAS